MSLNQVPTWYRQTNLLISFQYSAFRVTSCNLYSRNSSKMLVNWHFAFHLIAAADRTARAQFLNNARFFGCRLILLSHNVFVRLFLTLRYYSTLHCHIIFLWHEKKDIVHQNVLLKKELESRKQDAYRMTYLNSYLRVSSRLENKQSLSIFFSDTLFCDTILFVS